MAEEQAAAAAPATATADFFKARSKKKAGPRDGAVPKMAMPWIEK
jgi:hypothetical protein